MRVAKRILVGLGVLLLTVLLLVVGAAVFVLRTDAGRGWLTATANAQLTNPDGSGVQIGGIAGAMPGRILVTDVVLRDADGVWLSVASAAVEWNPLALLSGTADVDLVEVAGVRVVRPPKPAEPAAPEPEQPFTWPTLPVDVAVDRLTIRDVRIAEPVVGLAASLQADGSLGIRKSGAARTELVVERTDGASAAGEPNGRVELSAEVVPDQDFLRLALNVGEPAGGLIARALAVPGLPPVSIRVSGDGPLSQWVGQLAAELGEEIHANVDLTLAKAADSYSLDAAGKARLAPLLPEPFRPLAPDGVEFSVEGRMRGTSSVELARARIATGPLTAAASGTVDLDEGSVDARAELSVLEPRVLEPFTAPAKLSGADLRATITGPLTAPQIRAEAAIPLVTLPQAELQTVTAELSAIPAGPIDQGLRASATADIRVAAIKAASPEIASTLTGPVALHLDASVDLPAGRVQVAKLDLTGPQLRAEGRGETNLDTLATDADLQLAIPALAPLSPLAGMPLTGAVDATATIRAGERLQDVRAELSATLRDVASTAAPLQAVLGSRTVLRADVTTNQGTGEHRAEIRVDAPALDALANGRISPDFTRIEADYRLTAADLGAFAALAGTDVAGRGTLSGDVKGPLTDPDVTAVLRIDNAAVAAQALGTVDGRLQVRNPASAPQGRLEVSSSPMGRRAAVATNFAVAEQRLRLTDLRIETQGEAITGQVSLPLAAGVIEGNLSGRIGDLGPLMALGGTRGGGSGTVRLRLFGERGVQMAEGGIEFRDLRVVPGDAASEIRIGRVTADGRIANAEPPRGNLTLAVADLRTGAARVDTLNLTAAGNVRKLDLTVRARGDMDGPFTVDTAGSASLEDNGAALTLTRLQGTVKKQRLALGQPARLAWRPERVEVQNLVLTVEGGSVRANVDMTSSRVAGTIDVAALPLSVVGAFVPAADATGTISSRVQFSGTLQNPTGTLSLTLANVRFRQARELRPLSGQINADWRGGMVDMRATIGGFAPQPAQASLRVPLRLSESFVPVLPPDGAIAGSLQWQGQVEPLVLLLPFDDHRLKGLATVSLGVGGTISQPQASGTIGLTRGEYENLMTGTIVDRIELNAQAQGDRIVITRLTARDGANGTLQATGYAAFAGAPVQVNLVMNDFTVARRDDVTASIDANIAYAGRENGGGRVTGTISTTAVEIRLINRLPPQVVDLGAVEKGRGRTIPLTEPAKVEVPTAEAPGIELALQVSLPRRVFVRGRGLDSEWAGDFAIRGTASSPDISGELRSVRGTVSVLSNNFEIRPSTIRLARSGPGSFDVVLNVVARDEIDDLTVLVTIGGTAAAPKLTLTSEPALPQDEVLARVLFGKNTGQLSALEAVQLAAAVAELTGLTGGGGGILDFTRQALGLDVLRVGSTAAATAGAEASPTVTAGKYIGKNVFVGVEQGTTTESTAATVEIEVFPNVSIQSRVGQSGATGIGVKAEWDY